MNYRKIWENNFGPIPKDEFGFSYEIHHIDGDHLNNDINNLKLVTIKEHLLIHLEQNDWGAAALIAKRLGLGPEHISKIQFGKKRPGIGGAKKGNIPWNKNKKKCFSENTIQKFKKTRSGKRFGKTKISDEICKQILQNFNEKPYLPNIGKKLANGKILTYERAFSKMCFQKYNISEAQMYNIITGKRNVL